MSVSELVNLAVKAFQRNEKQEARRLFAQAEAAAQTPQERRSIVEAKIYCHMD
jgi:hypothetical protein